MWLVICILTIIFCCFFFINNYLNHEILTKIDFKRETMPLLPTVSFCTQFPGFIEDINNYLVYCLINNNNANCTHDLFEAYYDLQYGLCYRLNSGRSASIYQTRIGIDYGINLSLNATKLYVHIHENSMSIINPRIYMPLSSGLVNYFKIKKILTRKLTKPFNDCMDDLDSFNQNKTIIDYLKLKNRTYSQNECLNLHFNLDYIENSKCNCTNNNDYDLMKCFNANLNCSLKFSSDYLKLKKINFALSKYCPVKCDQTRYEIIPFTYNLKPTVNDNSFYFNVFYDNFEFMCIEEQAKLNFKEFIISLTGLLIISLSVCLFFLHFYFTTK